MIPNCASPKSGCRSYHKMTHIEKPMISKNQTAASQARRTQGQGRNQSVMRWIIAASLLLLPVQAWAQTLGAPVVGGSRQYLNNSGDVCNGCKLYTYAAGTTTPQATYSDSALTTANANPVVLSSSGRATIYGIDTPYKLVLCSPAGSGSTCSGGTTYFSDDYASIVPPPLSVLSKTANYTVTTSDGKDVIILCDASAGTVTLSLYTAVGNTGRQIRVKKVDTSANFCVLDANGAQTIDGEATYSVRNYNADVNLVSNGTVWLITAQSNSNTAVASTCEARLTATTGVPVTNADVTGANNLYFTPYKGNNVAIYTGVGWQLRSLTQLTINLTNLSLADATNYDLFLADTAGVLGVEAQAWNSATARFASGTYATLLPTQDGVPVKSTNGTTIDATRRYIGSMRTTSTTSTEDSEAKRFVYNACNPLPRTLRLSIGTNSWTYTTATLRQANGDTANQVEALTGVAEGEIVLAALGVAQSDAANRPDIAVAIGEDSTSAAATGVLRGISGIPGAASTKQTVTATLRKPRTLGYHYYPMLEYSEAANTTTWYGDDGGAVIQAGLLGAVVQ